MKIKIDMAKVTLGDMEDFEEITGASMASLSNYSEDTSNLPTKFLTALILIGKRKEDPDFTIEDVRNVPINELELEVDDSLNPQSESD